MKKPELSFTRATVIHSNKYNDSNGWYFGNMFTISVLQDVAFELQNTKEKFSVTYRDIQVPLYNTQQVILISIEGNVFAYLDKATNNYYYLTKDFQSVLHRGIKIRWFLLIAIVFALSIFMAAFSEETQKYVGYAWLLLPIMWIYQNVYNGYLESILDKYLKEEINSK